VEDDVQSKSFRFLLCLSLVAGLAGISLAQEQQRTFPQSRYVNGVPYFFVIPRGDAGRAMEQALAAANIPMWSGSFTYQSTTYTFVMIGTDPALGSATTNVPTVIIPLRFSFPKNISLSATSNVCNDSQTAVQRTQNSPILQSMTFSPGGTNVGTTQYIDAFQRANFWGSVSGTSPNYHVLLNSVTVTPLQTISVSKRFGTTVAGPCARIGEVDINFFDAQAQSLLTSLGIPATSFPIFLDYNTFLTSSRQCCILGYHSATSSNQTYSFAAYSDPGIFSVPIQDIHALSHEVGEWMDDPFGNNIVPTWGNVGQVSGCQNNLEDGDPVTGIAFTAALNGFTYHPEDLVFLPWFARQSPSTSVNGWYTFLNTFATFSAPCP
jgi:hypothetical protein